MLPTGPPRADEALAGYLWRVSRAVRLDLPELVRQVHPGARRRRSVLSFAFLSLREAASLTPHLPVDVDAVTNMTLARYAAFSGLPGMVEVHSRPNVLEQQRIHWWQFNGDRFCPWCLSATSTWLVSWLHPWSFVCVDHEVVLRQSCGSCNRPARLLVNADNNTTDERCACGALWKHATAVAASAADVDLQRDLDAVVHAPSTSVWSMTIPSIDALDIWRAASAVLAGTDAVPRWAPRPWLSPPTPEVTRAAFASASRIVTAPTVDDAANEFRAVFRSDDAAITNRLRDRLPASSPLNPVVARWQLSRARVATRLTHTHQQGAFDLIRLQGQALPTLAPVAVLSDDWRRPGAPHILLRRCAVSLAAARLGGAGTWADAAAYVGVTATYAPRITRYVISRMGSEAASQLTAAAIELTRGRHRPALVADPPIDSFAALASFATSTKA